MAGSLLDQLQQARHKLLDLSASNRLLNTPLGRGRSTRLDVVGERSTDVFDLLVRERREMTFGATAEETKTAEAVRDGDVTESLDDSTDDDESSALPQPDEAAAVNESRLTDQVLETNLVSDQLQKRLLRLTVEAKTFVEEQGVNCLFLALGFLEWYEDPKSDKPRFAPLVLIPVEVHRKSANAKFKVKAVEEDLAANLSLQEKLRLEFHLKLPDLPEAEELDIAAYFTEVEQLVADQPRWCVRRDQMTLWFFSFAKFLMFRDLQPEAWPEGKKLEDRPLVRSLLSEGFRHEAPVIGDHESLDARLAPRDLMHVVDADSSQTVAIEEMRHGRSLIVQGPPGTGKSQTITNMIAAAVKDGKSVLFVAEKMAALQVVKSRLDRIGLGDMCLELHSHKANKRAVYAELERALLLGKPKSMNFDIPANKHLRARDRLNGYDAQLHAPIAPFGIAPYAIIGQLCRLKAAGIEPLDIELPDVANWSRSTFDEKQQLLAEMAGHVREIGIPQQHVCWGIHREDTLLPSDGTALQTLLEQLQRAWSEHREQARQLAKQLRVTWPDETATPKLVQQIVKLTELLLTMPALDRASFANDVWAKQRADIDRAVIALHELADCRQVVGDLGASIAWATELADVRRNLAAYGRSWFRWFHQPYRAAQRELLSVLKGPAPRAIDERLRLVDSLITGQQWLQALQPDAPLGRIGQSAFGTLWRGADSNWEELATVLMWNDCCQQEPVPTAFRQIVSRWESPAAASQTLDALQRSTQLVESLNTKLTQTLGLSLLTLTGKAELTTVPLVKWSQYVDQWLTAREQINRWIVFRRRLRGLAGAGLERLIPIIEAGQNTDTMVDQFELLFCEAAMRQVLREREEIASFDRVSHEENQRQFQTLDRERLELARREVAIAHYDRIPTGGDAGEVGIVRGETKKKRNLRPVRKVLKDAGRAIQAMKPVFMMSPISVAQFLEPGGLAFDVLIIDEASQVRPVEALGAVARAQQLVVVGDNRQLPPSQFFDKATGDDEPQSDDGSAAAGDVESILDLCITRGLPSRMLRWHYRSKHHSLIAVSNREFYDSQLFVVPSPERVSGHRGLHFRFVNNGVFDSGAGASRTNRVEARSVALAMLEHATTTPHLSLGVGTFSVTQRDAILDELELLRRQHPEAEPYFINGHAEPWFVKNLENIQGDERDVILISVGYAKNKSGYFAMGFGPLSNEGGERRLNVLISRAKERCEVFSSVRAADFDIARTKSKGTIALKTFLEYAETGLLDTGHSTGRDFDSEFEAQVAEQLRRHGVQLECQVGVAGFFIDLAVIDPDQPGRYLMGIECDGATYHSSRWARDRDRLREQVLTDHGWKLYRIWSTDWFQSQDEQLRKLIAFIEDARSATVFQTIDEPKAQSATSPSASPPATDPTTIDREDSVTPNSEQPAETNRYREADFTISNISTPIPDMPIGDLAKLAVKVVQAEGPVHADEVARRLTTLFGQTRAGSRISAAVEQALRWSVQRRTLQESDNFYWVVAQTEFVVRDREQVASATLRKPEMLPPIELRAGVVQFVTCHISASTDECVTGIARMLGFKKTSQQLSQTIESQIDWLVLHKEIVCEGTSLRSVS